MFVIVPCTKSKYLVKVITIANLLQKRSRSRHIRWARHGHEPVNVVTANLIELAKLHKARPITKQANLIKFNQKMEVKQEFSEDTFNEEIYSNEVNDTLLDNFKNEMKEEPNRENTNDIFDNSDLIPFSLLKTEIEEDENKLKLFEEKQTNEMGLPQEKETAEIMNRPMRRPKASNLKNHMKLNTEKKPHKCDVCSKQFIQADNLRTHLRVHTGEKSYKCQICFKQYVQLSAMKQHKKVHTGEKPHKCEICFKQFSTTSTLKSHLRVHTGEKPHKSEICFKEFNQASSLKTHLRVHTGEKPYKC
ncbi:zinc finger protein 880-like isoform X3 [Diabrotica virgifera virgifera]|uniref:C2H2-type domain-containing protein n=1 Tax=Diabrotica virgifera virgifera TaxID=50390 RepID=A0ABM5KDF3_DIAVI|nr:zinc finger protein 880-like isoform X3 [Diabrotica virgifera virgifera]